MKLLIGFCVVGFIVMGLLIAVVGFVGIFTTDENSELYVRCLLYAILGLVMLICVKK